jgi:hypothetical protein
VRLRRVLEQEEIVGAGEPPDPLHVGGLAAQVDRDDRGGSLADRRLDQRRVDVVGRLLDVDADRAGAHQRNRNPGRDPGVGGDDHLVAGSDPGCSQAQLEGAEATADTDAVRRFAVGGELALEALQLGPEQIPARLGDTGDRRLHLSAQLAVGGAEVDDGALGLQGLSRLGPWPPMKTGRRPRGRRRAPAATCR